MNLFNYSIKTFNWLITVAVGVIGFLWISQLVPLHPFSDTLITTLNTSAWARFAFLAVSIYLVLFNVLYLFGPLFNPKYAYHIELGVAGGNFSISVSAIEHSLKRAVKKLPEVSDVNVHLYKDIKSRTKKPMRIVVHCSTWEGANVKEVTEKVKEIITLRFKEIIEVQEPPVFQIMISHIEERSKKPDSRKKSSDTKQHMFYGPEYPIDSDL